MFFFRYLIFSRITNIFLYTNICSSTSSCHHHLQMCLSQHYSINFHKLSTFCESGISWIIDKFLRVRRKVSSFTHTIIHCGASHKERPVYFKDRGRESFQHGSTIQSINLSSYVKLTISESNSSQHISADCSLYFLQAFLNPRRFIRVKPHCLTLLGR